MDTDKHDDGAQLWGIKWDDDTQSDYTLADMQKFCVQLMDGDRVAAPRRDTVPESSPSQGESHAPEPEPEGLISQDIHSDPTEVGSNFVPASMLAVKKRLDDSGIEYFTAKKSMSFAEICIPLASRQYQ